MAREDTRSPRASPRKRLRILGPAPAIEGEPSRKAGGIRNGGGTFCSSSSSSSSSLCCGICLSSVGEKTIRGQIDSCDHYFCFMCIREWAKVESKCPMCKRRFSSIRRPAVEGVFDTERVVHVPLRDQAVKHVCERNKLRVQRPPDDSMNGLSEVPAPDEDDYASNGTAMWARHSEEFDERDRGSRDSSSFSDGSRYTSTRSYEGGENSLGSGRQAESWSSRGRMSDGGDANCVDYGAESSRYNESYRHTLALLGEDSREEHNGNVGAGSLYRGPDSPSDSWESNYERQIRVGDSKQDDSSSNGYSSSDGYYEDHIDNPDDSRKEEHDGSGGFDSPYQRDESLYYCGRSDRSRRNQSTLNNGSENDRSDNDERVDYGEESSQYSDHDGRDDICSQPGTDSGQHSNGSSGAGTPYWGADSPSSSTVGSNEEDREQDEFLSSGGNSNDDSYDDHVDNSKESSHYSDEHDATHPRPDIDSREEHDGSWCTEFPVHVTDSPSYSRSSKRETQSGAGRRDESCSNRSHSIDSAREVDRVEYGKESSANNDLDIRAHTLTGPGHDLCVPERRGCVRDEQGEFASRSSSQRSPVSPSYSDANEHRRSTSPAGQSPGISPGTGSRSPQSHRDHVPCLDFYGFDLPKNQIKYLEGVYDLEGAFWEYSIVRSNGIRTAALSALGEILVLAGSEWSFLSKENLQHIVRTMHDVVSMGFKVSCLSSLTKKCKDRLNLLKEIEDLSLEKADLESRLLHAKTKLNQLGEDLEEVYDPLGIRTVDPYAESKCSVCNGSEDEWLLLLCDLCDVASHTYCVGLGFTVPMGDWFCPDCAAVRESQANGEENDQTHSSMLLSIVREGGCSEINRLVTRASPPLNPSSSVSNREEGPLPAHESKVPLFGARTRHRCRDVHSRIQALRDNWDALRHGTANFSSGPIESINKKNGKEQHGKLPKERDRSGKASSSGFQQSTDRRGENSASFSRDKVPDDVTKAWRMMDLAKSGQKGHNPMINVHHARTGIAMKGKASEREGSVCRDLSHLSNYSPSQKQKQDRRMLESANHSAKVGAAESSSRTKPVRSGNGIGALQDMGLGTALHVDRTWEKCTHMISPGSSGKGSSHAVSMKSEIQSLVKQNLKMLIGGKQLGVDTFKEIARASTHNILAACGLEHSKAIQTSSFASPVCPHREQDKLQHEAGPMPDSCRDCFNAFVKNVVGLIMREKTGHAR